jgi:ABC-type oligopeptide transport system substrate-binding subunit
MLPFEYYQKTIETITPAEFKEKWFDYYKNKKLKFKFREEYVDNEIYEKLQKQFNDIGLKYDFEITNVKKLFFYLKRPDLYDLILVGFFAIIPDPDGFLEPFFTNSTYRYGIYPTSYFLKELNENRFNLDKTQRLHIYAKKFSELEDEFYFIPLFRLYMPLIIKNNLIVPDSNYKYELKLYEIKNKK